MRLVGVRSTEQAGIIGGKRPFAPNIMYSIPFIRKEAFAGIQAAGTGQILHSPFCCSKQDGA